MYQAPGEVVPNCINMLDDETRSLLNRKRQEQRNNLAIGETNSFCIDYENLNVRDKQAINGILKRQFGDHIAMNIVFAQIKVLSKK